MKVFIHIGFGKCASSSIQTTLSQNPVIDISKNKKLHYICITPNEVITGRHITDRAARTPFGYLSSANASNLLANAEKLSEKLSRVFSSLPQDDIALLSCEGWCREPAELAKVVALTEPGVDCSFIAIVRAPVSWINSAFWQWGAWSSASQDEWIMRFGIKGASWASSLDKVKKYFPLAEFNVVPITRGVDVSREMFSIAGVPIDRIASIKIVRNNISLPLEILHMYLRFPELREGPHDSAIDFRIGRLIKPSTLQLLTASAWAIKQDQISSILTTTAPEIDRLCSHYFNKEATALIRADSQWIDSETYKTKNYISIDNLRKTPVFESIATESLFRDLLMSLKSTAR